MRKIYALLILAVSISFSSCCKETSCKENNSDVPSTILNTKAVNATISDNFEAGTKTAYAAANVTFSTGSWYLDNALVGNSSTDRKFDTKSIRVQNTGSVKMNFNAANGAGIVSIYHAIYGTDAAGTWELWYSVNNGSSWAKTGSTITTSSTSLVQSSFPVNIAGNIRFEIRKTSTSGRLNFDNFNITDNIVG